MPSEQTGLGPASGSCLETCTEHALFVRAGEAGWTVVSVRRPGGRGLLVAPSGPPISTKASLGPSGDPLTRPLGFSNLHAS